MKPRHGRGLLGPAVVERQHVAANRPALELHIDGACARRPGESRNTSNPVRLARMFFALLTDLSTRPERRCLGRRTGCLQNRGARISGFSYALARRHSEIHSQVSSTVRKAGLPDRQRSAGDHLDYRLALPLSCTRAALGFTRAYPGACRPKGGRPSSRHGTDSG